MGPSLDKHIFVILGGTGNLSLSKLLPAVSQLLTKKKLKNYGRVLGAGRKDLGDEEFRTKVKTSLKASGISSEELNAWCDSFLHYQSLGQSFDNYSGLLKRIESLEKKYDLPGNRVFYLALPPSVFPNSIKEIGESGLTKTPGWCRLVIEKPFGWDLSSAQQLNHLIHRYFDESQIYRIDHYLGKETVQNLLIFRFANTIFESLWNRNHIESVDITVAENIGIGKRSRYYEKIGALRDIVQNHLAQLLSLISMEVPAVFEAKSIRDEKVKVIRSIPLIPPENVIFGQYERGKIDGSEVHGYKEEPGVSPDSLTETYAAMRLQIDNWRWQGIPIYMRTGKRLPRRLTQITVNFRHPPVCMFKPHRSCQIHSNKLLITLQPDEGFHLFFDVKVPEEPLEVKTESLHFHYKDIFGPLPDAYQTLIFDIIKGDQTLFVRADEAEASWELFTPLLEKDIPVFPYKAGTWGPKEADKIFKEKSK